jgi:hypothetical protein
MKISALLREAPGTPTLSLDQDLMQRAKLKFPGYEDQQALSLYMADKLNQQQKIDASQNNLINTQRSAIETLQGELDANDNEIERIKQLTGNVTAGSRASSDALEKLQKQLEDLKSKPGMDPKKYKEIEQQITDLANSKGADDTDVKKLQGFVNNILNKANVNYDAVAAELVKTKKDLLDKEERFQKSLTRNSLQFGKNASDFRKYADIIGKYKKEFDTFDNEMKIMKGEQNDIKALRASVQQDAAAINKIKSDIEAKLDLVNDVTNKTFTQASPAQNDPTMEPNIRPVRAEPGVDALSSLLKGAEDSKNITRGAEQMIGRKIAEEAQQKTFKPLRKYNNPQYESWLTKHLPAFIQLFKNRYWNELEQPETGYSDDQIHQMVEKYTPLLWNLADDEGTPLTAKQINAWILHIKDKLWQEQPDTQLELFNENLDRILQLSSIKKG